MFLKIAIALSGIMYGFSLAVTFLVTYDSKELTTKREIMSFIFGITIFIGGILLLTKAN